MWLHLLRCRRWPPPKGGGGVELVMRILYWSCLSRALCKELARAVDSFLEGWNSRYLNLADAACVPLLMPAVHEREFRVVLRILVNRVSTARCPQADA